MRKYLFAIILVCSLLLTGCMRFNGTINVHSDGKVDFSMLYAMVSSEEYGMEGETLSDEEKQEYLDNGWSVEEYNADGYVGYVAKKKWYDAK